MPPSDRVLEENLKALLRAADGKHTLAFPNLERAEQPELHDPPFSSRS